MKNIRECEFWDNDFFGIMNKPPYDAVEWMFINGAVAIFSAIFGMFALGIPLDLFGLGDLGFFLGMLGAIPVGLTLIRLGKVYKGHSLENDFDYGIRSHLSWEFRIRAREYFSLPPEDRRLYPDNVIELMRDPDLTSQQKHDLDTSLSSLYADIQERNRQKRLLEKNHVDLSGVMEHIEFNREHIRSDINVYRELS